MPTPPPHEPRELRHDQIAAILQLIEDSIGRTVAISADTSLPDVARQALLQEQSTRRAAFNDVLNALGVAPW